MIAVYWISAFTVLYVYVGYPLLLAVWARLSTGWRERSARTARQSRPHQGQMPAISIVIAARNEAHQLAARLDNLLGLDYPADRRQIIVVSDGSQDDTAHVLARYRPRVSAVLLPPVGKACALNAGVAAATGELLVFADARQRFAPDALRRLVEPFADPRVGGVSGELVIDANPATAASREESNPVEDGSHGAPGALNPASEHDESPVADGVGLYWAYEKWLRQRESEIASTIGATGAIYALRRAAWRPLPDKTLLDDVLAPMRAVLDGYRVVFAPRALAYDRSAADAETERRRKVRTLAGNYQLLWLEPRLLLPVVNPVWLQFVSHKLGRLLVPYALVALLVSNTALAHEHILFGITLTLQVSFYVLAAHGAAMASSAAASRGGRSRPAVLTAGTQGKRAKEAGECAA